MGVVPPTEEDLRTILEQLDDDFDGQVSRDEFFNLIMMVIGKMMQNEEALLQKMNDELKKEQQATMKHGADFKN